MKKKITAGFSMCMLAAALMTGGCGQKEAAEPATESVIETEAALSVHDIYQQIEQAVTLNVPLLLPDDFITNYYGIDLSVLEEYVFEMSEAATSAETIVIMKANDGEDTGVLADSLQEVRSSKAAEMENYLPDQFEIVEKSEVKIKGDYVYLVISEQADAILEIIEGGL